MLFRRLLRQLALTGFAVVVAVAMPSSNDDQDVEKEEEEKVDFNGYRILQAMPSSSNQLQVLRELETTGLNSLEFWSHPAHVDESVRLSAHPEIVPVLKDLFAQTNMSYSVDEENLQSLIDGEMEAILKGDDERDELVFRDPSASYYDDKNYNRLSQIEKHLDELKDMYSSLMELSTLGQTSEGRPIRMVTVSRKDSRKRPAVWLDCGVHAREWISPSFCVYALKQLLVQGDKDAGLLELFDFYIVPVSNPDGYEFSWDKNRMWRKNRRRIESYTKDAEAPEVEDVAKLRQFWGSVFPGQPQQRPPPSFGQLFGGYPGFGSGGVGAASSAAAGGVPNKCRGVDPNRNFDIGYGEIGSTNNVCQDTYHGPSAFSEIESQVVRDQVHRLGANLAAFVSVHAYSQFWMSPHGYKKALSPHHEDQMRVMRVSTEALRAKFGTSYKYGPINKVIYQASGSSVDWVHVVAGVKYAFALELRDTGHYGFLLPVDQIEETNVETWAGLEAMALEVAKEFKVQ